MGRKPMAEIDAQALPLQSAVDADGVVWKLGELCFPCEPKTGDWHLTRWPITGLPILKIEVKSDYGGGVGFSFGVADPYPKDGIETFWGSTHFRKAKPSDTTPCEHVYNTHGICGYCKTWDVKFDERVYHNVAPDIADQEAIPGFYPPHKAPLQTRLQRYAFDLRASGVDKGAALLEEAIAEMQRYEDQYAKILEILTPEFKLKSYFPKKEEIK